MATQTFENPGLRARRCDRGPLFRPSLLRGARKRGWPPSRTRCCATRSPRAAGSASARSSCASAITSPRWSGRRALVLTTIAGLRDPFAVGSRLPSFHETGRAIARELELALRLNRHARRLDPKRYKDTLPRRAEWTSSSAKPRARRSRAEGRAAAKVRSLMSALRGEPARAASRRQGRRPASAPRRLTAARRRVVRWRADDPRSPRGHGPHQATRGAPPRRARAVRRLRPRAADAARDDARARYRAAEESGAGARVALGEMETPLVLATRPRLVRRRLAGRLPPHWIDFRAPRSPPARTFREMDASGRLLRLAAAARAATGRRGLARGAAHRARPARGARTAQDAMSWPRSRSTCWWNGVPMPAVIASRRPGPCAARWIGPPPSAATAAGASARRARRSRRWRDSRALRHLHESTPPPPGISCAPGGVVHAVLEEEVDEVARRRAATVASEPSCISSEPSPSNTSTRRSGRARAPAPAPATRRRP